MDTAPTENENLHVPQHGINECRKQELVVQAGSFEGPLDMLLAMARTQKVNLACISVLALAEQYLAFVAEARRLRLELAADYLVMAAWLTFLKSLLLLPDDEPGEDGQSGEELAQRLAFRLMRLEAMRDAAAKLMRRSCLGRDVFVRGQPEAFITTRETQCTVDIYDLLRAYAEQRKRTLPRVHVVTKRTVWSIKDARLKLEHLVGRVRGNWLQLDRFLQDYLNDREDCRTVVASSFGATLEMAREGLVDTRQATPFGPIFVRGRDSDSKWKKTGAYRRA